MTPFGKIAVVGLGNMGKALVQCFSKKNCHVNCWNRSEGKRKAVEALNLPNVTVYADLEACVRDSDLIIMNVLGDADLQTANTLIESIPDVAWKGKTMLQFTSQDPLSMKAQEKLLSAKGATALGGAMLAAPNDVGTDHAMFLISASDQNVAAMNDAKPIVEKLGTVMAFEGDVGYAALVDFGLIETIFFGLAGHEITHKLMQMYGASKEIQERYAEITITVTLAIGKSTWGAASQAFLNNNDWEGQGKVFNAAAMIAAVEMHTEFIKKMGLLPENFMTEYLKSLVKVKNMEHGTGQITDVYEQEGKKQ